MNQQIGTYEYIDMNFVLAGVKSALGIRESTSDDAFLKDAINTGVKELRIYGTIVPIVTQLEIDRESATPKAKLPDGFIRFVKKYPIVYVNAQGNAISGVSTQEVTSVITNGEGGLIGMETNEFPYYGIPFSQPVFANNTFFENSPYNANGLGTGTVSLVDGYLYFSTNVIADFVKISYIGTNFNGADIKIPATAELAVRFFACEAWATMMFAVTKEPAYNAMKNDFYVKYARNKAKAKVVQLIPDSLEYQTINRTFKSLL